MHFGHVANFARPQDFGGHAVRLVREALIAHLRGDLVFDRRIGQQPRLPSGAGQRFFEVDVFTHLHACQRHRRVHEVGNGNGDRVKILALFVEQRAEVAIDGQLRVTLQFRRGAVDIHIAKRDDVLRLGGFVENRGAASSTANCCNVQLVVVRLVAEGPQRGYAAPTGGGDGTREQRPVEKVSS